MEIITLFKVTTILITIVKIIQYYLFGKKFTLIIHIAYFIEGIILLKLWNISFKDTVLKWKKQLSNNHAFNTIHTKIQLYIDNSDLDVKTNYIYYEYDDYDNNNNSKKDFNWSLANNDNLHIIQYAYMMHRMYVPDYFYATKLIHYENNYARNYIDFFHHEKKVKVEIILRQCLYGFSTSDCYEGVQWTYKMFLYEQQRYNTDIRLQYKDVFIHTKDIRILEFLHKKFEINEYIVRKCIDNNILHANIESVNYLLSIYLNNIKYNKLFFKFIKEEYEYRTIYYIFNCIKQIYPDFKTNCTYFRRHLSENFNWGKFLIADTLILLGTVPSYNYKYLATEQRKVYYRYARMQMAAIKILQFFRYISYDPNIGTIFKKRKLSFDKLKLLCN